MPRINIEDSLYRDGRFIELCLTLKSKWTALGALTEAWSFAQDYVNIDNPLGLVPLIDWNNRKICNYIIEAGLAEVREDKVYLRGAEKHFNWLISAKIKGQKGGLARASSANLRQAQLAPTNPLSLSPSLSPSLREEFKNTKFFTKNGIGNGELAKKILQGIRNHGRDDVEGLKAYVGIPLFDKVRNLPGGWAAIRSMKEDNWTLTNLIKSLDDA